MGGRGAVSAARAGATTLATAAVAVATLEVLQETIAAFNPRPVMTALIAVSVGLGTLSLERLRVRKRNRDAQEARDRRIGSALRWWPIPRVRDATPYQLGVFPPPRNLRSSNPPPYVRRLVDYRIKRALKTSSFVLVFGPPRAGKSRTAFAAVREALPEARLVAPRDAEALREIVSLDPPLKARAGDVVVWLDDLERFLDVLDDAVFEALARIETSVTVVATIRTTDYDAILGASGERGEHGKAIAMRARAFELPTRLAPEELEEAERLYPDGDFGQGLGVPLSASGKDEDAPLVERSRPVIPTPTDDRPQAFGDRLFAIPAVGSAGALVALGIVALTAGFEQPATPSVGDQVEVIKRDATAGDRRVVISQPVAFRGSGRSSYLFVFQAKDFYARYFGEKQPGEALPPSDEVRIYDQRGTELVERFRFRPTNHTAVFKRRFIGDLDDNGEHEVIAGYGIPNQASEALLPFIIYWDNGMNRYEVKALLTEKPELTEGIDPEPEARRFLTTYATPLTLTHARREVRGYRAQDFVVMKNPQRLGSALAFDPKTPTKLGRVEVRPSIVQLSGARPRLLPCRLEEDRPLVAEWSHARELGKALERSARRIKRGCAPTS